MQGAGTGELNYLSQFDIKGSDQILGRALTENCHIHSDTDLDQDTLNTSNQFSSPGPKPLARNPKKQKTKNKKQGALG